MEKSDFKQFCLANFSDLVVLSVARQFFTNRHSGDFNTNISLLSQINKNMSMRASFANKSEIILSNSRVTAFYAQFLNYGIVYLIILPINVISIHSIPTCSNMYSLLLYSLFFLSVLACIIKYIIFLMWCVYMSCNWCVNSQQFTRLGIH